MRIHAATMSSRMKRELLRETREGAGAFEFTDYSMRRAMLRGVTLMGMSQAIREGELVEYHWNPQWGRRVVMRGDEGTCVVVGLDERRIVTAYLNAPEDKHATLRTEEYLFGGAIR